MKRISLNIVMTYPVHWPCYQILRDFVQNFYDSVGYLNWKNNFHYSYADHTLCMWVNEVTFHYEWLLHIGASTKTSNSSNYAGYFGEGFKIAALCGYRDFGWSIQMMSGDWKLDVISQEQTIDNMPVKMLAYAVWNIKKKEEGSKLILKNVSGQEYDIFLSVLNSFYYPENSMMGKEIWVCKECAVYTRSLNPVDSRLPITKDYGNKGVVFCGYQMLGTNPFGLVICLHKYKKEDRERRSLYKFEVIHVFEEVCYYIDSKGAMAMLEKMRRYWNSYPQKHIDIYSWSGVIDSLIKKVAQSQEVKECFANKYKNLLCLKRVYTVSEKNKRGQARTWLSQQNMHYILVKDSVGEQGAIRQFKCF